MQRVFNAWGIQTGPFQPIVSSNDPIFSPSYMRANNKKSEIYRTLEATRRGRIGRGLSSPRANCDQEVGAINDYLLPHCAHLLLHKCYAHPERTLIIGVGALISARSVYRERQKSVHQVWFIFIAAVDYHFFLSLPAAFTQPGAQTLADPCRRGARSRIRSRSVKVGRRHDDDDDGRPDKGEGCGFAAKHTRS